MITLITVKNCVAHTKSSKKLHLIFNLDPSNHPTKMALGYPETLRKMNNLKNIIKKKTAPSTSFQATLCNIAAVMSEE